MNSNPLRLSKLSHLKHYLEHLGISPKKSLSQNFLIDANIIDKTIDFAEIKPGDEVLDIGSGPGAITDALLSKSAQVFAVEKDKVLAKALAERIGSSHVICEDILKVDLEKIFSSKATIVANLPFSITSPILTRMLPKTTTFKRIVVIVQHEIAERLIAPPGNKTYSSLTVFANLFSKPKWGFKVSSQCFFPKPKVDSAVLRFDLITPPAEARDAAFLAMIRTAFGQRRKMLKSSLRLLFPTPLTAQALASIGFCETARPEELSAQQFVELYRYLKRSSIRRPPPR